jgi:GLPGLI family protein
MKKIINCILFLSFSCLLINAQETINTIKVEYDLILNTDFPVQKKGELIISNKLNQSIFYEVLENKENKIIEEDGKIRVIVSDKNVRFNHTDFNKNILISSESASNDEFNVTEPIPSFQWKLQDSTKIIGNFECKLATSSFRGRNYFAWYTENYPLKFGPWKFNGLPGLIVNAYDDSRRYIWSLTGLKTDSIPFNKYLASVENKLDTLSIEEFVQKKYGSDLNARLISKLPRNTSFKVSQTIRNGKEIRFEWEEEDQKD